MKDKEANIIIAEYMGTSTKFLSNFELFEEGKDEDYDVIRYTKSLDSLVPVWIRLKTYPNFRTNQVDNSINEASIATHTVYSEAYGSTIQQAAAYVTAKAIKALDD